jgi:hypothetical protein
MLDVEHRTNDLSEARPLVGRTAIVAQTTEWLAATPRFVYDVLSVLADGRSAAVLWRYQVKGASAPPSLEGVSWLVCEDGVIRQALVFFDSHAFLRRLERVG